MSGIHRERSRQREAWKLSEPELTNEIKKVIDYVTSN